MGKTVLVLSWLGAAVLCWLALAPLAPGPSERFYLLFIPAALGTLALAARDRRTACFGHLKRLAASFALFSAGAVGYALFLSCMTGLPPTGLWSEALTFAYYVTAVVFLVTLCHGLIQAGLRRLLRGSREQQIGPWREATVKGLSLVVLLVVATPYLIAVMYVHRFKVGNVTAPQERTGRSCEDVAFVTEDGLTLRGWFLPCADASSKRTLLICHGLGMNRSGFLSYVKVGDTLNAHVLMFDFRGHGDSDGRTVTLGHREKLDVLAAVRYLRAERPRQAVEVIGLGISMGAASLTRAAAEVEPPLDAVILDSGFASAVDLTDNILEAFPPAVRPCLTFTGVPLASLHAGCDLNEVRPEDCIENLRAPVLILHAQKDDLIPAEHARRLYARARPPRTLWIAPTEGHCSVLHGALPEYLDAVRRLVPPAPSVGSPPLARR